ncbi:MAG: hypothetical protein ACOH5I_18135 [Oligoflexus sp.]
MKRVKRNLFIAWAILVPGLSSFAQVASQPEELPDAPYEGSYFRDVWDELIAEPYEELPQNKVTIKKFFLGARNLILEASKRTLSEGYDILPYFEKLVHPNGICFKGTWNITEENPYTGYFRPGTEAMIIVRASTALSNTTRQSGARSFGVAGKIYPTNDPYHTEPLKTANFFTINDLGGERKDYFLDAENTNDILAVTPTLTAFAHSLVGAAVFAFFPKSEDSNVQTALVRELYPISELGEAPDSEIVTPVWLKITGSAETPRVLRDDFRDELDMQNYPKGIRFDISVASEGKRIGDKDWQKIGFIDLDESVVSVACDHKLHFAHPKRRDVHVNPLAKPISGS